MKDVGVSVAGGYDPAAKARRHAPRLWLRDITLNAQQDYPGIGVLTQRSAPITVLIVEQRPLLSSEVRSALAADARFEIVGECSSAVEATRVARSQRPDLVLCEAALPESGATALALFLRPRLPRTSVVFHTQAGSEEELFDAVQVGAAAYLQGTLQAREFVASLIRVARGEFPIDELVMRQPSVASRVLSLFRVSLKADSLPGRWKDQSVAQSPTQQQGLMSNGFTPVVIPLSAREVEILDLAARGNSNKRIARELGISDQTVKNHVTTILKKLGANDRTEAVVSALRNGWIGLDTPSMSGRSLVARGRQQARRTGGMQMAEYARPAYAGS